MRLTRFLLRLAQHTERIFDSSAAVLRLQRKIPECGRSDFAPESSNSSFISLCTNDYLSLTERVPVLSNAELSTISRQPAFAGIDQSVLSLEKDIAKFYGRENALATASYDHAIWSLFSALVTADDAILIDAFTRPIVQLAARSSRAKCIMSYHNCSLEDLEHKLKVDAAHCRLKFVVTDGFFELGSNIPPLVDIGKLVSLYEPSLLVLNDAPNLGLLGSDGKGLESHFNVEDLADVVIGGFEYTFGLQPCGYITSSSSSLLSCVRHSSIAYSRSPSLCPNVANLASSVLRFFSTPGVSSKLLKELRDKVEYFRSALEQIGFCVIGDVRHHPSIIVLLHHRTHDENNADRLHRNLTDTAGHARIIHKRLLQRGIEIGCPLPPLVPFNGGRLRIDISVSHSYEQLDLALQALEESADGLKGVLKGRSKKKN